MLALIEGHMANVVKQNDQIVELLRVLTQKPSQAVEGYVIPQSLQNRRNKRTDACGLITPDTVLCDPIWKDKKWVGKVGEQINALTIALAQRAFFGDAYLKTRCVLTEFYGNPPLTYGSDKQKLDQIKNMVKNHIASHQPLAEYEISWKSALKSLQKHITHLRAYQTKTSTSFSDHSSTLAASFTSENNENLND